MSAKKVLKQIRDNRRFELEAVAGTTGISSKSLKEFEEGSREPSFKQIVKLAEAYNVPSYMLAAKVLPNLPPSPVDFRKTNPRPASLTPNGMKRIWDAESVAQSTKQLLAATKTPLADWASKVPSATQSLHKTVASNLRQFFDEWQGSRVKAFKFSGTREQVFLGCFRLFLEAQGVVVRINQAPPEDFVGFYLDVESGQPVTFVNRKISSYKAQLFTAVHEYGHRLANLSGVSNPFSLKNNVERHCNHFAAQFLAPEDQFSQLVKDAPSTIRNNVFKLTDHVSEQSLLSKHATAIRLSELGFITSQQFGSWKAARDLLSHKDVKNEDKDEVEDGEDSFGNVYAKIAGEVGYLPTYLAGVALSRKLVTSVDIAQAMSLSLPVQEKAIDIASRRFELAAR